MTTTTVKVNFSHPYGSRTLEIVKTMNVTVDEFIAKQVAPHFYPGKLCLRNANNEIVSGDRLMNDVDWPSCFDSIMVDIDELETKQSSSLYKVFEKGRKAIHDKIRKSHEHLIPRPEVYVGFGWSSNQPRQYLPNPTGFVRPPGFVVHCSYGFSDFFEDIPREWVDPDGKGTIPVYIEEEPPFLNWN